jgi:hypothetical protein
VFGTLAWFGEIAIGGLKHGVLVAVAELSLHGSVAVLSFFFLFQRALQTILIRL